MAARGSDHFLNLVKYMAWLKVSGHGDSGIHGAVSKKETTLHVFLVAL